MKPPVNITFRNLCLAALVAIPATLSAVIPHQVRRSTANNATPFASLFGKTEPEIAASIAKADDKALMPFAGPHSLHGCALYSASGFQIVIVSSAGKKAEKPADVGGELTVQLREGTANTEKQLSPVIFSYDLNPQKAPPKAKPRGESTGVEEDSARAEKSRFTLLAPDYNNYFKQAPLPAADFHSMPKGWRMEFTFNWVNFLGRIPFKEGKLPLSWRLLVTYRSPTGEISTWGTLDDPVVLNWARGGDAFVNEMHNACLLSEGFGPAYKEQKEYFNNFWTTHRTEKYIGYFDPGKPTFETKNPDSDEEFYLCFAEPVIKANHNLEENTYFNYRDGPQSPKALKLQKTFVDEIFANADRVIFANYFFGVLRRDYLLAKFSDRKVFPPPQKKAKKKQGGNNALKDIGDLTMDELESDTADNNVNLDDLSF